MMKRAYTVACISWQAVSLRSALAALFLAPLVALCHAAESVPSAARVPSQADLAEADIYRSKDYNVLFISVDEMNDWVGCLGGNPSTAAPGWG